jgi:HPt (histidine-containing phosphotransfer) domain-containing protein
MSSPDLEQQLVALRKGYASRLPGRVEALAANAADLIQRWDPAAATDLQRHLHNLAGSGASYGFPDVSYAARAAEDACSAALNAGENPALTDLLQALEALSQAVTKVQR